MTLTEEFECRMRYEEPWLSPAIEAAHDELYEEACGAHLVSEDPRCAALAEFFEMLAAHLMYCSVYVAWYGRRV